MYLNVKLSFNLGKSVEIKYLRLRVCSLIALKGVGKVMFVVHIALGTQVIVIAYFALPTHTHDTMFLAAITDDVGMSYTWV